MRILGIETSCDETALSIIESTDRQITVLADKTLSQIDLHKQYGGVFPNLAKREHSRNLVPLLRDVLQEYGIENGEYRIPDSQFPILNSAFEKEPELLQQFLHYIPTIMRPSIDAIAVTEGPGLEPCLWTGINLAKALSLVWDVPVIAVNHMEGHILSALLSRKNENRESGMENEEGKLKNVPSIPHSIFHIQAPMLPALALLISGGHTELVLVKELGKYEIIGETRDDAVGEAFDKVARLLGLSYPGGPQISALAETARMNTNKGTDIHESNIRVDLSSNPRLSVVLPRPMLHSGDFDFSFSGIKTSVLYLVKKLPELTDDIKKEIALEFENAVTEVLVAKTKTAAQKHGAQALLIGGGVIANTHIRRNFETLGQELGIPVHIPEANLTTDNALMIAAAGYFNLHNGRRDDRTHIKATGNRRLDEIRHSV